MTPSPAPASRHRVARALWQIAWQDRWRTGLALLLLVLAKLSGVLVPLLLKAVVDRFSRPETLASPVAPVAAPPGVDTVLVLPVFLLLAYAGLRFAGTLFTELRDLVFAPVALRTVSSYLERSFAHLLSLGPAFHGRRNTGALIRDVERGTAGVGFLLGAGVFTVVPTLVEFAAVVAVMAWGYSGWFTGVILTTFLAYAVLTTVLTQTRALRQRRVNEVDSRASGRMVDGLLNYETVKVHAREAHERTRHAADMAQWMHESLANQRSLSVLHLCQAAVIALGVAGVMLLAGEQTVRGAMSVGDLVLVNAYLIQVCLPLNALGFVFRETRDALVDTEALFELLDQTDAVEDDAGRPPLALRGGAVEFQGIGFGYEAGRRVLDGVDLTIPAGQTVAVVGGSGSGKSTLARLLLRLHEVQDGRILIDGQDIRDVSLASLRQAIGLVPQDTSLFNESIAYNIGYGREQAGMASIVEAAQAAQLHEFILSLPAQYDTPVGERGLMLSGGERQRVAIARAFLKNPPIMVFDEATSALDSRAERAIQRELDRIALGRSTLVIAHRLSTVVHADQIVVMDRGRIAERGRHEELLASGGLYAQLWALQAQQQQVERLERKLARRSVDLAVLAGSLVEALRSAFEPRGVSVGIDVGMDDARVIADPSAVAEVLWTLGMHAHDATPAGGHIALRLARAGPNARLTLTDGRHLPAEPVPPVSGRSDPPMDPLGVRSTIERQGGRFVIEPASSRHGMRFLVDLPLQALAAPPSASGVTPASPPAAPGAVQASQPAAADPLQGLTVMLVEDHADAREALQGLLAADGATCLGFASATQALAWLRAHAHADWSDVLLCDIGLGDMDGHALMRQVRDLEHHLGVPHGERLPALALTGHADAADRALALAAGFDVHLGKPVPPQTLVAALRARCGRA